MTVDARDGNRTHLRVSGGRVGTITSVVSPATRRTALLRDRLLVHPRAAQRVLELLAVPDGAHAELCALVELDPALTAAVLRAANSAHLGFSRRIAGIRHATVLLGGYAGSFDSERMLHWLYEAGGARMQRQFRDETARKYDLKLIVHTNQEGRDQGINPFDHGSSHYTQVMKTEGLRQALDGHRPAPCACGRIGCGMRGHGGFALRHGRS